MKKGGAAYALSLGFALLWCAIATFSQASAQSETGWSEPVVLSTNTEYAWFPDIAVDGDGRVHVVYDTMDIPVGDDEVVAGVMHTFRQDGEWTEPNDVVLGTGRGNIFRPAITTGPLGNLHMTHSRDMWYRRAHVSEAHSAAAWYSHALDSGISYISDVAVDSQGTIHAVYERWVMLEEPITTTRGTDIAGLSDVFYRRSSTGGRTWTAPVNLSRTTYVGSHRVQLEVDTRDVIHVAWDEGWDRWSLYGEPRESVYISSFDGGGSWSQPVLFTAPQNTNAQTAVASDNQGGVLMVWRPTSIDLLYYAWSTDDGQTWSTPTLVPGLYARSYNDTTFDAYDMVTDSAGRIHLVAVGLPRLPENRQDAVPLGVYHLVWNGAWWSWRVPIAMYSAEEGFPEYPKAAISEGNRLHVVWFVRQAQFGVGDHMRVLYSDCVVDAPHQPSAPVPTQTPTPHPTSTPLPPPTFTPLPTVQSEVSQPPRGLYTEYDELSQILLSLSPVVAIIVVIGVLRLRRRRY